MELKKKSPLVRTGGAYDDISAILDENTFFEIGSYVSGESYASVVCGYGSIDGALTFVFAQDLTRDKGALGQAEVEKICSTYDMAIKGGAPIIGIWKSAGARINEGERALSAYGKLLAKITKASGIIPQIAVVDGVCGGMSSAAVSMFDIIVASKDASFYVNPPFVLKNLGMKDAGKIERVAKSGLVDIVCESGADALAKAKELVSSIPQNNAQGLFYVGGVEDDPSRPTPEFENAKDAHALLSSIADCGRYTELKPDFAPEIVTALATVGYATVGVVATEHGKTLTPAASRKAATFISFCDNFMIPVITLVDTDGIDLSVDAENAVYAPELSRLAAAYAGSTNTKITAIVGKAYGAAYTLLGSKAVGADVVLALEGAEISVMEPDAAVQFLYGDKIKTPADREARKNEWTEIHASAIAAASTGDIDDVVAPAELRARVIAALNAFWAKASGTPYAKHSKLPF